MSNATQNPADQTATQNPAIYLDQKQCKHFDVPYFGDATDVIAAEAILKSKGGDGYDQFHKDILVPLSKRGCILRITRKGALMGPGWFTIENLGA